MYSNWIKDNKVQKDKEITNVNQVIDVISKIRSFKNELNVSPGSFIDISIENIKKDNKKLFVKNEILLKKLGRINNIYMKNLSSKSADLVISGEILNPAR